MTVRRSSQQRESPPFNVYFVIVFVERECRARQVVDAVVEGRIVVSEAEVVVSEAGPQLLVVVLEAGAEVPPAELLEGAEDLLLLPPGSPERLDTEDPTQLEHDRLTCSFQHK